MNETIRCDETIGKGGFSVINMGDNGDISDAFGIFHEPFDHFIASLLAVHFSKNTFIVFTNLYKNIGLAAHSL